MKLLRDLAGHDLVKSLHKLGYAVTRQSGSHVRITRIGGEHHEVIPNHSTIKIGTLQLELSGHSEPELANALQIGVLASEPQIVGILHCKPAFRASTDGFGQAQGHLRRDATGAVENTTERGCCDAKLLRKLTTADIVGLEIDARDELARMRGVVHAH